LTIDIALNVLNWENLIGSQDKTNQDGVGPIRIKTPREQSGN
jgi:hypothetical protein